MISLVNELPEITENSAEFLKIKCLFESYKDDKDTLFWAQDKNKAFISFSRGDMIIKNNSADTKELKEFISVISPRSIFSDSKTLNSLGFKTKNVNVMFRHADIKGKTECNSLSSKEIFDILNVPDFYLPAYPDFAVDYCRRKNKGYADYFGLKEKCAAVTFNCGEYALLNGIVSRQKGYGSIALKAILQKNYGRKILAVCDDSLINFYQKNGFEKLYEASYQWIKQI